MTAKHVCPALNVRGNRRQNRRDPSLFVRVAVIAVSIIRIAVIPDLHQSLACWRRSAHFLTVVEEGNLHRAAARLHISQSTLSRQMQVLELKLGGDYWSAWPPVCVRQRAARQWPRRRALCSRPTIW